MTQYRIDNHKLMFHPHRVSEWMDGKNIAPIYMEISPTGACNHRCLFCGLDFMGYKPDFLDQSILLKRIEEIALMGLKSIMYAGEGEPLCHNNLPQIIEGTKKSGIDVSLTTNGVLLTLEKSERILPSLSWIKISCNAGTKETHAHLHGTSKNDFSRLMGNLKACVALKHNNNFSCTLGIQAILLPENYDEMERLARISADIGLDYLVIKPYSHHPKSQTKWYKNLGFDDYNLETLSEKLDEISDEHFKVILRTNAMERQVNNKKDYDHCLGLPFWSYIDSTGNVWGCSVHMTDSGFLYGNIYSQSFNEIWSSPTRKKNIEWVANEMDAKECRVNCRLDAINNYLWELTHPNNHVNFI
ncbi:Similar to molybdenum cofactor biosynthesis protein A [Desulfamplus magnetovallimortis]|uniref:Similar to molybdenum cofactor biosynthesis protein A n=1 Tax=Desulfamplus magnetovallimortis TaxID=1246637 RepID=A0A1W1HES2_9BACT|nr:radical SAM protein [Desulfamplus magnetovallimortis]SLM30987.1 Similar to molybdenum cofactor biosynthesis protein A [Desulfamplus magnetovallimortis]